MGGDRFGEILKDASLLQAAGFSARAGANRGLNAEFRCRSNHRTRPAAELESDRGMPNSNLEVAMLG